MKNDKEPSIKYYGPKNGGPRAMLITPAGNTLIEVQGEDKRDCLFKLRKKAEAEAFGLGFRWVYGGWYTKKVDGEEFCYKTPEEAVVNSCAV